MSDPASVGQPIDSTGEMIVATPGTYGGKPRIAGHRIRVQDVVVWNEHAGMTLDDIVSTYPGLIPEKIVAALRYYQAHREEIERDLKEEEELADSLEDGPDIVILRPLGLVDVGTNSNSSG
jgi:uncharacterized protein (DUF433 family)